MRCVVCTRVRHSPASRRLACSTATTTASAASATALAASTAPAATAATASAAATLGLSAASAPTTAATSASSASSAPASSLRARLPGGHRLAGARLVDAAAAVGHGAHDDGFDRRSRVTLLAAARLARQRSQVRLAHQEHIIHAD